ncbi:MAG: hypothetical protein ACREA4_07000, partial [Nitrososphaera sp.]
MPFHENLLDPESQSVPEFPGITSFPETSFPNQEENLLLGLTPKPPKDNRLSNILLQLGKSLLTPAKSRAEVLGNVASGLLDIHLKNQEQERYNRYYQAQIQAQALNTLTKRKKSKAGTDIAEFMEANPGARWSDAFLKFGKDIPEFVTAASKSRKLEDQQEADREEVSRRELALADIFKNEEDPVTRAFLKMGEEGAAVSLIRQQRAEELRRTRPEKPRKVTGAASDPGYFSGLNQIIEEAGLTPDGRLVDETSEDPTISAAARGLGQITEAAVAHPSEGNYGRALTALQKLNDAKAKTAEEAQAKTFKLEEKQEKLQFKEIEEQKKAVKVGRKSIAELAEHYEENVLDRSVD